MASVPPWYHVEGTEPATTWPSAFYLPNTELVRPRRQPSPLSLPLQEFLPQGAPVTR